MDGFGIGGAFGLLQVGVKWLFANWLLFTVLLVVLLMFCSNSHNSRAAILKARRRNMIMLKNELERRDPNSIEAITLRNTLLNANVGCARTSKGPSSPKPKTLRRSVSFSEEVKVRYFDKFKRVEFEAEERKAAAAF